MEIGSLYSDYLTSTAKTSSGNALEKMGKKDFTKSSDDELLGVCKEFEAYFYEQIFKNMKEALVPASESSSSANQTLVDYYGDNLTAEYSKSAADQSENGLAQMLYEQMKRNYSV